MKKKTNSMTLDKLARMSQHEFLMIGERFNKVDERFDKIEEDNRILRNDVETGFGALTSGMKAVMEKLNEIQRDVIEIHDLRGRVERLEKKVGLAR